MTTKRKFIILAAALLAGLNVSAVRAQTYPAKPIKSWCLQPLAARPT